MPDAVVLDHAGSASTAAIAISAMVAIPGVAMADPHADWSHANHDSGVRSRDGRKDDTEGESGSNKFPHFSSPGKSEHGVNKLDSEKFPVGGRRW
jgi:hypothetical protein